VENLGLEIDTMVRSKIAETRSAEIETLALAVHGYDGIVYPKQQYIGHDRLVAENL